MQNLNRDTQGALVAFGTALMVFLFLLVISAANSDPSVGGILFVATLVIIAGGIIWAWRKAALNGHQEPLMITDSDTFTQDNSLPPRSLLQRPKPAKKGTSENKKKARLIEQTLQQFEVPAKVVAINEGPRLTQFGIEPGVVETAKRDGTVKQRKVKVSAITGLADDLSLALGASVRLQARVPGCSYVGLEVPNDKPQPVFLADVATDGKGRLPVALGLDVAGQPVVADITNMPHALIAGATGSGKSVCVNALIASLLMRLTPHELNLLMIDPKMVELVQYEGLPHLVAPVITDMEQAASALKWAVSEMERRYQRLKKARKRNIVSYNEWAKANNRDRLPYLVIIIDELADLMMTAGEEVEPLIVRLAQLARAVGIHLILATQRPSVDVVTGLIKANVPTRIAFAVASSTDSRVILDRVEASALLGRGDMLYLASDATHVQRIQGCFVSDEELDTLIEYWRNSAFDSAFGRAFLLDDGDQSSVPDSGQSASDCDKRATDNRADGDELLPAAMALRDQHGSVSTTFLQRKLRIGYPRAARLIDMLKERGLIGSVDEKQKRSPSPAIGSAAKSLTVGSATESVLAPLCEAATNNAASSEIADSAATPVGTSRSSAATNNAAASEAHKQRIAALEAQLAATEKGLSWNNVWPVVAALFRESANMERVNMKTTRAAAKALGASIGREVWGKGTWRDITAALTVYAGALPSPDEKEPKRDTENEAH